MPERCTRGDRFKTQMSKLTFTFIRSVLWCQLPVQGHFLRKFVIFFEEFHFESLKKFLLEMGLEKIYMPINSSAKQPFLGLSSTMLYYSPNISHQQHSLRKMHLLLASRWFPRKHERRLWPARRRKLFRLRRLALGEESWQTPLTVKSLQILHNFVLVEAPQLLQTWNMRKPHT